MTPDEELAILRRLEQAVRDWKRGSFTCLQELDDALADLDDARRPAPEH